MVLMGRGVLIAAAFTDYLCQDRPCAQMRMSVCWSVSGCLSVCLCMRRWTDGLLRTRLKILLITTLVPRDDSR